jgi:hypothetical protein
MHDSFGMAFARKCSWFDCDKWQQLVQRSSQVGLQSFVRSNILGKAFQVEALRSGESGLHEVVSDELHQPFGQSQAMLAISNSASVMLSNPGTHPLQAGGMAGA